MQITTVWNYRFIVFTFLFVPYLQANIISTSKLNYYTACLLGKKTRSPQEIWRVRRNVGIASASALFITSIFAIRKLYMALDIMPDITHVMSEFEYDYTQHEELPDIKKFIKQTTKSSQETSDSNQQEKSPLPTTATQKEEEDKQVTSTQDQPSESLSSGTKEESSMAEKEEVAALKKDPEQQNSTEQNKPAEISAIQESEEKAIIVSPSTELNGNTKDEFLATLSNLNNALMAYIENPNTTTKKSLKETYIRCYTIININENHAEKLLSLKVPEKFCSANVLIHQAKTIYNDDESSISVIRKMQQPEKVRKLLAQTITPQEKEKLKTTLDILKKEFRDAVTIYEQNKSEENLIAAGTVLFRVPTTIFPLAVDEFFSATDLPIIEDIQEKMNTLTAQKPQLFLQMMEQCKPNDQFFQSMGLPAISDDEFKKEMQSFEHPQDMQALYDSPDMKDLLKLLEQVPLNIES